MTTYVTAMAVNYFTSLFFPLDIQFNNVTSTQNYIQIHRQDHGNFANAQRFYIRVAGVLPLSNIY